MRNTLLTTAALLGLALAAPAFAQSAASPADPNAGAAMPQPSNSLPPGAATGTDQGPPAAMAPAPDNSAMAPASPDSGMAGGSMSSHKVARHHHKSTTSNGDEKFAHEPGTGESGPASAKASNIDQADSHSDIAPHLPMPKAGHDATADAYLGAAQRALKAHHTGEAQQALEMAETRLLDRSTPAGSASSPAQDPQILKVSEARKALGHGDMKGASESIKMALATTTTGAATPTVAN